MHAEFGEAVLPFGFEAAGSRRGFDQALAAELIERFAGDAGADTHRVGDAHWRGDGNPVEGLEGQVFDEPLRKAQLMHVVGSVGECGERAELARHGTGRGALFNILGLHREVARCGGICLLHDTFPHRGPCDGPSRAML